MHRSQSITMKTTTNPDIFTGSGVVQTWNDPHGIIMSDGGTCIHVDIRGDRGTKINTRPGVRRGLVVNEKVKFKAKITRSKKKPFIAVSVTGIFSIRCTTVNFALCIITFAK